NSFVAVLETVGEVERLGPRADQRHVTDQNIQKLGQLVELAPLEQAPDSGHTRIARQCHAQASKVPSVTEFAKLIKVEMLPVAAEPELAKKYRTRAIDPDQDRNHPHQGCQDDQRRQRAGHVEGAPHNAADRPRTRSKRSGHRAALADSAAASAS